MSLEVAAMIERYLEGGDHSGFGRRNPFDKFSGGGGAAGLAKALAAHVTVDDCPDQDTRYSAMLFGQLLQLRFAPLFLFFRLPRLLLPLRSFLFLRLLEFFRP